MVAPLALRLRPLMAKALEVPMSWNIIALFVLSFAMRLSLRTSSLDLSPSLVMP
jgi:hypothetical protein